MYIYMNMLILYIIYIIYMCVYVCVSDMTRAY